MNSKLNSDTTTTTTTVKYSESEVDSTKKESVLIPIENQYQNEISQVQDVLDFEEDESDGELELEYSYGYRGRHYLNQSGSKKNGGSVRPVKKKKNEIVDDELEGENVKLKEGGNASGK